MKKLSWLWSGALVLALSLGATQARADDAPPRPKKQKEGKAKAGEACKDSSDCDQSGGRQICREGKCAVQRVPPPT